MKPEKVSLIIFYISMSVVIAWVILKLAGVIHSPVYQEVIPVIGFVVAVFSLGFSFGKPLGRIESKVDRVGDGVRRLGEDFRTHMDKHHK